MLPPSQISRTAISRAATPTHTNNPSLLVIDRKRIPVAVDIEESSASSMDTLDSAYSSDYAASYTVSTRPPSVPPRRQPIYESVKEKTVTKVYRNMSDCEHGWSLYSTFYNVEIEDIPVPESKWVCIAVYAKSFQTGKYDLVEKVFRHNKAARVKQSRVYDRKRVPVVERRSRYSQRGEESPYGFMY